jgi:hypothetical protein
MGGGRRGHGAVARIEKLVAARRAIEDKLDHQIQHAVVRAEMQGVPWPRIARALGATSWRVRRRYRLAAVRTGRRT